MIELKIPKLGMTMEKAKLLSWESSSGDTVKKDDTVFIIETDKITYEVPSPGDGIVHPVAAAGETYPVAHTVGYLAADTEEYERLAGELPGRERTPEEPPPPAEKVEAGVTAPPPETRTPEGRIKASPIARRLAAENNLDITRITGSGPGGRVVLEDIERALESPPAPPEPGTPEGRIKVSPIARRLAAENNLDITRITGSGPGGRIVLEDIERALEGPPAPPDRAVEEATGKAGVSMENAVSQSIPIAGVRRVIFDNMFLSLSQSAQLTLQTDASAEPMVSLREDFQENGIKISYNAILIKACARALRRHPGVNASVDGDSIQVWEKIHIGLAMEANESLVVPVVRSPDQKTVPEIEEDLKAIMEKAANQQLGPDDLAHGTFTITNLGFVGVDHFTPIIRPPESAVLGVGRIRKKPVVRNNRVVSEARIGLSLTFDHRIIDGAPAGRFLKTIVEMIEKPALMFF